MTKMNGHLKSKVFSDSVESHHILGLGFEPELVKLVEDAGKYFEEVIHCWSSLYDVVEM